MKILIYGRGAQQRYVEDILDIQGIGYDEITHPEEFNQFYPEEYRVICCSSNLRTKEAMYQIAKRKGFQFGNAIHPSAIISPMAMIGNSLIINPLAVIQNNAIIENGCMIHSGVIVEHNSWVGAFSNLSPGVILTGYVTLKKRVQIYTGSIVVPKITIGEDAIIAGGAFVMEDVKKNVLVKGIPARIHPVHIDSDSYLKVRSK